MSRFPFVEVLSKDQNGLVPCLSFSQRLNSGLYASQLIEMAAVLLGLPQLVSVKSSLIVHKYLTRVETSEYNTRTIAATALLLGIKFSYIRRTIRQVARAVFAVVYGIENQFLFLDSLVNIRSEFVEPSKLLCDILKEEYFISDESKLINWIQEIERTEMIILRRFGFLLSVAVSELPHVFMPSVVILFGLSNKDPVHCQFVKITWAVLNDSHLLPICATADPLTLLAAALVISSQISGIQFGLDLCSGNDIKNLAKIFHVDSDGIQSAIKHILPLYALNRPSYGAIHQDNPTADKDFPESLSIWK